MAIELSVNPKDLDSTTEIELDGTEFIYRIYWQEQYDRWYMDIQDISGVPIITGKKLTVGSPSIAHELFKGQLVVLSKSGDNRQATISNLGSDILIIYITEAELLNDGPNQRDTYEFSDFVELLRTIPVEDLNVEFLDLTDWDFLNTSFEFIG